MAPCKQLVSLLIIASVAILVRGRDKELRRRFREIGFSSSCVAHLPDCCLNREKDCSDLTKNQQQKLIEKLVARNDRLESSVDQVNTNLKTINSSGEEERKERATETQIQNELKLFEKMVVMESSVQELKNNLIVIQDCVKESVTEVKNELKSLQISLQNDPRKPITKPRNCWDIQSFGDQRSGVRTVYPFSSSKSRSVFVFCNQTADGGGWTVIQRRDVITPREEFDRYWREYRVGFGNIGGEHWLGLDNIHALVKDTPMELMVDLEDTEGQKRWAKYDHFFIEDAAGKYRLHLGNYSGNAGDSFTSHNGMRFSTKDHDNDVGTLAHCAESFHGAWWYENCYQSTLNGIGYNESEAPNLDGIHWLQFHPANYSLKSSSMMLRPNIF